MWDGVWARWLEFHAKAGNHYLCATNNDLGHAEQTINCKNNIEIVYNPTTNIVWVSTRKYQMQCGGKPFHTAHMGRLAPIDSHVYFLNTILTRALRKSKSADHRDHSGKPSINPILLLAAASSSFLLLLPPTPYWHCASSSGSFSKQL